MKSREPASGRVSHFVAKPAESKTTQIKFRLSDDLHRSIQEAAEQHRCGVSEEIRMRLEASFLEEFLFDDETRRLVGAIKTVSRNIRVPFGPWHRNRFAFEVLRAAVNTLMGFFKPTGDPVRPSNNDIADLYLGEAGTPEIAGKMLAGGAATAAGLPVPGAAKQREAIQNGG
jgi:hypothetical protein